jgi:hypothetical protein
MPIQGNGGVPANACGVYIDQTGVVEIFSPTSTAYVSIAGVTFLAEN